MKTKIQLLLILLVMVSAFITVSYAGGYDNPDGCRIDSYGCWLPDENGGKMYIMFWSEEARAFFMGGHSNPGDLVVPQPETGGFLRLDKPTSSETIQPRNFKNEFIALIEKYGESLGGELEYYKNEVSFISEEVYNASVKFYKDHFK